MEAASGGYHEVGKVLISKVSPLMYACICILLWVESFFSTVLKCFFDFKVGWPLFSCLYEFHWPFCVFE